MNRTVAAGAAPRDPQAQAQQHPQSPLTAYQRDIWAAGSQAPQSPQFNCVLHERLRGTIDHDVLAACVESALHRHATFRLRFAEHAGKPVQWVAADESIQVGRVDLTSEPEPRAACAEWMRRSMATALPLTEGGALVEATLLLEGPDVTHLHVKAHHIVADGWTVNRLSHEILEDYARATGDGGPGAAGPRTSSSYLAFIEEEAAYRAGAEGERDRAFHREALAGVAPALFPRTAGGGGRGRHSFVVDGHLADRVRAAGLSPFAYRATMFGIWLTRLHRTEEVVLGIPFLNRPADHHKDVLGQFANTLPLRFTAPGERTIRELVAATQDAIRALRPHARLSLGDILRELPTSAGGPRQLFDVTVSYLRWPRPAPIPGVERQTVMMAPSHEQDALGVVVSDFDDTADVRIDLDYALDVFDEDLPIASVAGHLATLMEHGVAMLDLPATAVPMLRPAEHRDLTAVRSHGPQVPYADDATLHGLFEEQAARRPGQTAVVGPTGETLTYAELDERANRIARALREEGVGPDDRVAVMMERGPQLLAVLLGTLKSGGAYVPVDRGYPSERVQFLLEDSRAKVVIVDGDGPTADAPPGAQVRHVEELLRAGGAPLPPLAGPRDLAYVIYTSGSTGRPKGVMVEHHSVVNRLAWMQRRYPLGDGDVLLQKTPVSFDVSVWELFWWAVEGAAVALLPPGGQQDPQQILRTVRERRVTVVHFVPSMLAPFLDLLQASPQARADARSLRHVFCSGEALPPERVEQFNDVFGAPDAECRPRLVNLYGPTEATVDVSYYDCPGDPARGIERIPIGRPIDNTRLYVLGPDDLPQPVGVAGELCIGGVGVARGYLDRPELTAEKFTPDPFTARGRIYRTGDLARWLTDGTLEYLGRIDGQVKIRGNRVELGEVASALRTAPGVRDALVTDHTTPARGTQLIGYYVADDAIDPAHLRELLARTLPAFMVPASFVRIDAVPLTPNGKADRRALPLPEDTPTTGQQPRNRTEAALAEIWAGVLGRETVGVHDDYFTLGGDSILMLKVRARAEAQGLRFSLTDLLRNPTVAGLATRVDSRTGPSDDQALAPFALISGVDRARLEDAQDAWPLTRLQLGLVYHSRRHATSATYKDVFQYTLELPWDEDVFRRSFDRLVARHPALRSTFALAGFSEPLQIVHSRTAGGLDVVDLRTLDGTAADAEVRAHIDARRRHAYAFDQAPPYLFRAHVRPDGVELVLSFHHALLDGGSVATLLQELLQDYAHGLGLGIDPVDDPQPPTAASFAQHERDALASPQARRYWREKLAGCEPLQIEAFTAHLPTADHEPVTHRADLSGELVAELGKFAAEQHLPVKSVLFAAHCLTLAVFAGTHDLTTGLLTHGRPELAHAERTAGLFLNALPLRLDVAQATWLDVAREAFRQEWDSHPHRRYPLSAIQEDHGGPVLDTAFNYVHFHQLAEVLDLPGVHLRSFRTWEETNFRLLVNAVTEPDGGRVWLRIDGDGDTLSADQVRLYARAYSRILRTMVQDPHAEPDFAFLADRPALAPATPHPTVVDRFIQQATRTPQATALVRGEERWSYAQLARTADTVARNLRALGAPPQARIGIAMDRSPRTIAVILGVLRAGAAVVPLDVGYPAQRLAHMLEQARPFRVIAHAAHAHLLPDPALLLPAESTTEPAPDPVVDLPSHVPADSTAYVLFTSGSTGRPKGVTMPHRALANLVAWQTRAVTGVPGGATLQYAPLSFDVSFQEIFSTLCSGGTLHLMSDAERRDMPGLLRRIDREGIERVFLPYVALQQLAETAQALDITPRALRVLISSGEQLRITQEIRGLCAALPGAVLENQYGPTETHVATAFTLSGDPAAFPTLPPIGSPIDGAEAHVLDDRLRPVPAGARGTLYLGGACLSDGYEGRRDLTKERFVPHPFAGGDHLLYDTGDLGLVLADGTIAYAGRADTQVKVRGHRVELAEVELALNGLAGRYPGLRDAAVVARRHENGDCFLVAFLVGDDGTGADLTDIRRHLRTTLPDHMVPSHLQWTAHLPLTPSGKRDDAALRRLPLAPTTDATTDEPRDAYESTLAQMLADLLHRPTLGVHDSLFDLGGTSLTAMRLVVQIEQRYGVNIPLAEFIATPTVAGLAARLRAGNAVATYDPLVPIRPHGTRPPLFMVHPMGGNVLCYLRFARHLPDDQPLHALQAAGADPGTTPLHTVEEIAHSYLTALRRVQPHGPYTLGGWSFGGFVAFEMARQLRAAGQEVDHLVLLDTTALSQGERHRHDDDALLGWFFWELLWLERGGDSPLQDIPRELTSLEEKFDFIARLATEAGVLPVGSSGAVIRRLFRVYQANWQAALDYRPRATDQELTLIRALEPLPDVLTAMHGAAGSRHTDATNGWGDMTDGPLHVVGVPGDHLTIMEEPHVHHVAKTVADLIRTAPDRPHQEI
ncbi:amino acid adenylation domain-containing protein [Streptomyces yunnanensis]|uniref:Amino acid adenylation domain-containing protein n=1 Tax=Streptomyces yunnanensis TaxID=156453 RepID=A0ABY8A2Z6_9ACTN|nr:non-ribosomal peptide synthetase [Streptomyces yunnanensis]WEB38186.1 amino acid adenylation domain-containing protein [Streptomyces yunnanensis]